MMSIGAVRRALIVRSTALVDACFTGERDSFSQNAPGSLNTTPRAFATILGALMRGSNKSGSFRHSTGMSDPR